MSPPIILSYMYLVKKVWIASLTLAEAAVEGAPDLGPGVVDAVLVTDLCGRVKQAVHVRGVSAFYSYIMNNLSSTMWAIDNLQCVYTQYMIINYTLYGM